MADLSESTRVAAPEPQGGKSGVGGWIAGVFLEPKPTFEAIASSTEEPHPTDSSKTKDKSKWWLPVVISIVVAIGVALYTVPRFVGPTQAAAIREQVIERGGSPEQAEQAIRMSSAMMLPMSIVGVIVVTFIILFVTAGVAHVLMKMVGGKGRFRQARAIVSWSLLITALGSLIKVPIMAAKNSMIVETGPSLFFKNLEPSDKMFRFLSTLDIFTLWWLVLLVIGLAIGYRTSYGKSVVTVVILWILMVVVSVFTPGGLGAGM
jgi:hypothetical protein